jgi:RNA polymerase sigma-70 factor, ECF subfamily
MISFGSPGKAPWNKSKSAMRFGSRDHSEFNDPTFLAMLRDGDQRAYQRLIRRFHGSLVGVAAAIIGSHAQGEEVVQDAWLAVHAGIGRFEGRSSLITWIFSIVLNRARTRASREARTVGLPDFSDGGEPGERAVPLSAFQPDGHWVETPHLWDEVSPERIVGGRQLWEHVQQAIERLPAAQRAVLILRDIEQCEAQEACDLLQISAENQRVLLHRARGRIRATIDSLIGAAPARVSPAQAGRRTARPTAPVTCCIAALLRLLAHLTRGPAIASTTQWTAAPT